VIQGNATVAGSKRGDRCAARSSLVWPIGLLGMAIAAIINVGLYETAKAAGTSFGIKGQADVFETFQALTTGFREVEITNVLINTVAAFLVGLAVLQIALRSSVTAAVVVLCAGVTLALLSVACPMSHRLSGHARELLARMHFVTGALFAVAVLPALVVARVRRRK
jgi:hypothetical protein